MLILAIVGGLTAVVNVLRNATEASMGGRRWASREEYIGGTR